MFGIVTQINESELYLLNDMVENQLESSKNELSKISENNTERIIF